MSDRHLSPIQFARSRRIGLAKVYGLIASGQLAAVNYGADPKRRPMWRISPEAIAAFEGNRSAKPASNAAPRRAKRKPDYTEYY